MHPHLYKASRQVFRSLVNDDVHRYMAMWGLPFTAVSMISNRSSIFHRDTKAAYTMYDLLVTVGPGSGTKLVLPDLNVSIEYSPGTVVGIAGRLIRHGVTADKSARLCHAYYFRDSVFRRCGVMNAGYMSQAVYTPYMSHVTEYLVQRPTTYSI